jgi:hypothetical protein
MKIDILLGPPLRSHSSYNRRGAKDYASSVLYVRQVRLNVLDERWTTSHYLSRKSRLIALSMTMIHNGHPYYALISSYFNSVCDTP